MHYAWFVEITKKYKISFKKKKLYEIYIKIHLIKENIYFIKRNEYL